MKKMIQLPVVLGMLLFGGLLSATAQTNNSSKNGAAITATTPASDDWMKTKSGTWPGVNDGKTYWYKLDKDAKLHWSTDGKAWSAVPNGMWADKSNRWLKVDGGKLVWSADMGASWGDVPEGKWEASDSRWYKFDKDWTLWVKK